MRHEENYSLLPHNTFGIHARTAHFIEFESTDELRSALQLWRETGEELFVVGRGSNVLFTRDFQGWIFHSAIRGFEINEETDTYVTIRVGSGETWDNVIEYSLSKGLSGGENLSNIPGEVGASAVQNIGAYGVEVKDLIESVEALEIKSGRTVRFENADCRYSYRQSIFKNEWRNQYIITHVTYKFSRIFTPHTAYGAIQEVLIKHHADEELTPRLMRRIITDIRQNKLPDPEQTGNAGSFFMNPVVPRKVYEALTSRYPQMPHYSVTEDSVKIPAGWLIEQCGWKGKSIGDAVVYEKQALVLINKGRASGNDVLNLCKAIQADVKNKFDIEIHPEVNIL